MTNPAKEETQHSLMTMLSIVANAQIAVGITHGILVVMKLMHQYKFNVTRARKLMRHCWKLEGQAK